MKHPWDLTPKATDSLGLVPHRLIELASAVSWCDACEGYVKSVGVLRVW